MSSASPCSGSSIVGIAGRYTSVDSDVYAMSALSTTNKDSEVFEEFKFFLVLLFEWGAEFARLEIGSFKFTQICIDKICAIIAKFKRFSVRKLKLN